MMLEKIKQKFRDEFPNNAQELFSISQIRLNETNLDRVVSESANKPGIYIFLKNNRVIKVGRHLVNAHKRALQHIKDKTHNKNDSSWHMGELNGDTETVILFFTIEDKAVIKDKKKWVHWVCALEPFFELNLNPEIHSDRLC